VGEEDVAASVEPPDAYGAGNPLPSVYEEIKLGDEHPVGMTAHGLQPKLHAT
jgi:hypothetical protein